MSLRIILGERDVTDQAGSLSYSCVDPGGFEAASFTLPNDVPFPLPGTPLTIWTGLGRAWMGRVEEPGDDLDARAAPSTVTCVGPGAALKDQTMSFVYIDRDLKRWTGPSRQRQINLIASNFTPQGATVAPDTTTGAPTMDSGFDTDSWDATSKPVSEPLYDAGEGNLIGRIKADWTKGAYVDSGNANWNWDGRLLSDDVHSAGDFSGNLRAAGPGTLDLTSTGNRRFATLDFFYVAAGGAAGSNRRFAVYWTNLRVFGEYTAAGLTIRGATPATEGFYPSDIANHARSLASGIAAGVITESTSYILPHAAYYTRVHHEQIIDDMAKLLGWHWGVWEPLDSFSTTPRLDFRPPPSDATAWVARSDCQQLKLTQRLSDFHNRAEVRWTDPAGTSGTAVVTLANPNMPAGLTRTLPLDAGTSTALVAAQIGTDALALEQQQARAAGSVILPAMVSGARPSHLLRAGLDRLRIVGLPGAGSWTDPDTRRLDVFRIRRLTVTRDGNGALRTTAELDSGSNLLEVLQARLSVVASVAA